MAASPDAPDSPHSSNSTELPTSPAAPAASPALTGLAARPERLLVVAREAGGEARYCFARWPDWPHPAMLSLAAIGGDRRTDVLEGALDDLLGARMGFACDAPPRLAAERTPARMAHPRFGGDGLGWLRAVAVVVRPLPATGAAPAAPRADALLEAVERLSLERALEALPTDVERLVFRAGVALLD